jgi:hypothetical protein
MQPVAVGLQTAQLELASGSPSKGSESATSISQEQIHACISELHNLGPRRQPAPRRRHALHKAQHRGQPHQDLEGQRAHRMRGQWHL